MAVLGGSTKAECKEFISGLIGASHTFVNSAYFHRLFIGLSRCMAALRFLTVAEAAAEDLHEASQYESDAKVALLSYLWRWIAGRRKISTVEMSAIRAIARCLSASMHA